MQSPDDGRRVVIILALALLFSSGLVTPLSALTPQVSQSYSIATIAPTASQVSAGMAVSVVESSSIFGKSAVIVFSSSGSQEAVSSSYLQSQNVPNSQAALIAQGVNAGGPVSARVTSNIFGGSWEQVESVNGPVIFGQGPVSGTLLVGSSTLGQTSYNFNSLSTVTVTSAIPGLWIDSAKRRSRSQIYVEILELMKRGPMTPFEIAFYARLNHKRTKAYTEFLKRSGYLETVLEDGRVTYVLTKNGLSFLERVKALFQNEPSAVQIPSLDFQRYS